DSWSSHLYLGSTLSSRSSRISDPSRLLKRPAHAEYENERQRCLPGGWQSAAYIVLSRCPDRHGSEAAFVGSNPHDRLPGLASGADAQAIGESWQQARAAHGVDTRLSARGRGSGPILCCSACPSARRNTQRAWTGTTRQAPHTLYTERPKQLSLQCLQ